MPRYYFDVQDREGRFVDEIGLELPNVQAATAEARRALADMVRDALREQSEDAVSIAIRTEQDGPIIITVNLTTVSQHRDP